MVIRPIEPDDRAALAEGFERLSPESRYRRFFAPVTHLSEHDLDYLTCVDHHDHEALVAIAQATGEGVGVARYVRTGPDVAEPAIVVVDDWQGRGVGSRLLDALVERAREEGIRRFKAPVLAYNADAIHLLERLGQTTRKHQGREVELTIDLPDAQAAARVRPLLRQFATGALEPARILLERLWPRRRGAPGDPERNLIVVGTDGSEHAAAADRDGGRAGGGLGGDGGRGRRAPFPAARPTGDHGGRAGGGRVAAGPRPARARARAPGRSGAHPHRRCRRGERAA